jgi:hypothetical protein
MLTTKTKIIIKQPENCKSAQAKLTIGGGHSHFEPSPPTQTQLIYIHD